MANSFLNLSQLNGTNGFALNGIARDDFSGYSVSGAGDINGDGIDDLIIGARGADPNGILNAGQSYVVFGGAKVVRDGAINLSTLDGANGFALNGIASSDLSGTSVSGAGDINGDGIDDLIIGARGADPNGISSAGQSYVVFGGAKVGGDGAINLSTLDGANGFALNGIAIGDISGIRVSGAGDINGDGIDDLIIGARGASPNGISSAGQSYVVFGGAKVGGDGAINLSTLDGANGFALNGIASFDLSGYSVSGAGDINGDGIDDLIIGAFGADLNRIFNAGQSYVVFGGATVVRDRAINLSTLDGANGFALNGIASVDSSGISVSGAGDINGDGIDDLIIGASGADPNGIFNAGQSYVVFGGAKVGGDGAINLSTLDGANGFALNGIAIGDISGISVSGAGDINGDGIDDLIIGASGADPNGIFNAGQSYVVFGGGKVGVDGAINLSTLDGANGFALNGIAIGDISGTSVSGAGDINGDGIDDLIIGARNADPNGILNAGQSYVVFGNIAPTLDLNGAANGTDFTTTFRGTPVPVVATANLTLTDNNPTLISATVTITNLLNPDAENLSATVEHTGITAYYDTTSGVLSLTGTDTLANYQQVLRTITYNNTAQTPDSTERLIEFVVDDGQVFANTSAFQTTTLNFSLTTNTINGTSGRDILTGTPDNDRITGLQGADTLTGGGGNDVFVYNTRRDGLDTITDFQPGADVILLSPNLFQLNADQRQSFNYQNAVESGYLAFRTQGDNSVLLIDPDGITGSARPTPLISVLGVSVETLANANNFVI